MGVWIWLGYWDVSDVGGKERKGKGREGVESNRENKSRWMEVVAGYCGGKSGR